MNKKITSIALVLASNLAFSGEMGPVSEKAWSVGAQALYLQPALGVGEIHGLQPTPPVGAEYRNFNPSYGWGFEVEGAYHFNPKNDINLNWYNLENRTYRSFGNIRLITSALVTGNNSSIDPSWNAANFEVAQKVEIGDDKSIRFHGGVQYARILNNELFDGTLLTLDSRTPYTKSMNRTFNGFGPRLGADMMYMWRDKVGAHANVATAILAGTQTATTKYSKKGRVFELGKNRNASISTIVPEIEVKLAGSYVHSFGSGFLILDAGWMWVNYFDAVLNDNYNNGSGTISINTSNFGLQGLFFGLKWRGKELNFS